MSYIPPSLLHLLSLSNCQVWGVLKDEPSLKIIIYLLLPHTGWKKHRITHWWSNQILLSPYGIDASLAPLAFPFGNRVPLEGEPPIKTSDHWLVSLHVVFKVVPVNGVNHWAHNGTGVFSNPKTHQKKKKKVHFSFWFAMVEIEKLLICTFPEEALSTQARTRSGSRGRSAPHR